MSLDKQVALTRPNRGESSHLSKAARQVVPPFLQKLYEIVNDPRNDELIRWSESGDSFYVLNHERFAREVLGRWFKHQKFTSFVRQLNMYGFHKIPHLQQGVLKSDTDTEPWNFEHPHFHRGQPDLLCLIQRKKQPAHGNGDDPDLNDAVNPSAPLGNMSNGQVLDVNSIVNGIQAIKRHQQAISADLQALKKSNDILWEEATLARRRYDKHQDTISRILKFLAGVFGHSADAMHKHDVSHPPNVVHRMRQRLMIGDGRPKGKPVEIAEVDDDDMDFVHEVHPQDVNSSPFAVDQIATIEPTDPSVPSPSVAPSEAFSPVSSDATSGYTPRSSVRPTEVLSRTATNASNHTPPSEVPMPTSRSEPTISPNALTSLTQNMNTNSPNTEMWQAAIQQVLNSPGQMQRLMQALAAQQNYPMVPPSDSAPMVHPEGTSQLTPFDPNYNEYSRYRTDFPISAPAPQASLPLLNMSIQDGDEVPSMEPLLDNASRLQKTYRDAAEIEADMDVLQSSINSLISNLGMDPNAIMPASHDPDDLAHGSAAPAMDGMHTNGVHANGMNGMNGSFTNGMHADPSLLTTLDGTHEDASPDLFLESLLNGMSGGDGNADYSDVTDRYDPSTKIDGTRVGDASTEQLTAFLDEVSDTASPLTNSPDLKPANMHKRKSDVADLPIPPTNSIEHTPLGPKVKRKR